MGGMLNLGFDSNDQPARTVEDPVESLSIHGCRKPLALKLTIVNNDS